MGWFPMHDEGDGLQLYRSHERALLPLDGSLHIPRSLRRSLRAGTFHLSLNRDFETVLFGCADRPRTWISPELHTIYHRLHADGLAHSVEAWDGGGLAAGMLCIGIGACWIGESMFHRRPQAGNVLLVELAQALGRGGFDLFDVQINNPHLERFGCRSISDAVYGRRLAEACRRPATLSLQGDLVSSEPWMAG
jgi:leucyl/phenylalanyl-tRNA---protein transferase